ncbi:MAG: ATP-binding protein [Candidatus Hodarchaeales archaeon]
MARKKRSSKTATKEKESGNATSPAIEPKQPVKKLSSEIIREPSEVKYQLELEALKEADKGNTKPENWELSPEMVLTFILGSKKKYKIQVNGKTQSVSISKKFYGDRHIVERALVTLASDRGLLLVGEPGTGKSWLSEHLAAAICGDSTLIIQGTAGTTEEQIKYSWNIALLIAEGPSRECLIKSPTMTAMEKGQLLRFEEITRCNSDIQDSVFAKHGFNVISTANLRDKGVNELSAALKRRFNYITIPIIKNLQTEVTLVEQRTNELLANSNFKVDIPSEVIEILCKTFHEIRDGQSAEGVRFTTPKTVMSTAEEIAVLYDAAIFADFFGNKLAQATSKVTLTDIARTLQGSVVKEDDSDLECLREYWNLVLQRRSQSTDKNWKELYDAGKSLF